MNINLCPTAKYDNSNFSKSFPVLSYRQHLINQSKNDIYFSSNGPISTKREFMNKYNFSFIDKTKIVTLNAGDFEEIKSMLKTQNSLLRNSDTQLNITSKTTDLYNLKEYRLLQPMVKKELVRTKYCLENVIDFTQDKSYSRHNPPTCECKINLTGNKDYCAGLEFSRGNTKYNNSKYQNFLYIYDKHSTYPEPFCTYELKHTQKNPDVSETQINGIKYAAEFVDLNHIRISTDFNEKCLDFEQRVSCDFADKDEILNALKEIPAPLLLYLDSNADSIDLQTSHTSGFKEKGRYLIDTKNTSRYAIQTQLIDQIIESVIYDSNVLKNENVLDEFTDELHNFAALKNNNMLHDCFKNNRYALVFEAYMNCEQEDKILDIIANTIMSYLWNCEHSPANKEAIAFVTTHFPETISSIIAKLDSMQELNLNREDVFNILES